MKRLVLLLMLAALVIIAGCNGSGGSSAADKPMSAPTAAAAKPAEVTFSVKFPSTGGTVKSLIDPVTTSINVYWCQSPTCTTPQGTITLTPAAPSATVKLPATKIYFKSEAFDAGGVIDGGGTAGTLMPGANTVVITFLGGKWTLKDATGVTDAPIELSNGLVVDGFLAAAINGWPNTASPDSSVFDPVQPNVATEYLVSWSTHSSGSATWSDTTRRSRLTIASQFSGGTSTTANVSAVDGGWYNLTRSCGDNDNACRDDVVGDRAIVLAGPTPNVWNDGARALLPPDTITSTLDPYITTKIVDGTTIAGNLLEIIVTSVSTTIVDTGIGPAKAAAAVLAGKKAAMNNTAAGVFKTAQTVNTNMTVTNTWTEAVVTCGDGYNGTTPDGLVSLGTWTFLSYVCPNTCLPNQQCNCTPDPTGATSGRGTVTNGVYEYYLEGHVDCARDGLGNCIGNGDPGECNWGLKPTNPAVQGEYCPCGVDTATNTCWPAGNCGTQVPSPWMFYDLNGDGVIDFGSWAFAHYLSTTEGLNLYIYPVTLKGTPTPGTQVTVQ